MITCNIILENLKIFIWLCAVKSWHMIGHMKMGWMSSILEISSFSVMKNLSWKSMTREAGSASDLFNISSIFVQSIAQDCITYGTCLKMKFSISLYEWNAWIVLSFGSQVLYCLADVICAFEKYYYYMFYISTGNF